MKQRLGIAATLLTDPDIIFLDEPTNGLDPSGTVDMRNMIIQLGQEGHTVFLSSHLLHEVEHVCSDVAIVQHGVMIKQGKVSDLTAGDGGYAIEAAAFERAFAVLRDTWKMTLPRQGNRIMFILIKLLIGLAFMALLIVLTLLAGQIAGWLGVLLLGGSFTSGEPFTFAAFFQSLVPTLMQIVLFACVTLVAAVVTRSSIGGIVLGFVAFVVFNLAIMSTIAARIVPTTHLENLNIHWLYGSVSPELQTMAREQMTGTFGMEISATTSLMVVIGYVVGCIVLALLIFRKRDMAGQ